MESRYIFIDKCKKSKVKIKNTSNIRNPKVEDLIHPVRTMMNSIFKTSQGNIFRINIDDTEYEFNYKRIKSKKGLYSFEVVVDYSPSVNARVLDEINNKICKGEHRKDYEIIVSYSSSSEYYCNKLYPVLNTFERRIKNLIFLIVTETYGVEWINTTVPEEIKKEMKSRGVPKNKLVEIALYEMTMSQLEDYLFSKWREVDADLFLNQMLSKSELENFEKEEIITKIENNRAKSLWERLFEDKITIDNLQEILSSIRQFRNIVAHSKLLSYANFCIYKKSISKLNKDLDKAYDSIINDGLSIDISLTFPTTMTVDQLKRALKHMELMNKPGYLNAQFNTMLSVLREEN